MKGDLHTHSYYSDGRFSPATVVQKAAESGCDFLALTDHDSVDGIPEADEAAKALGVRNIHGVELSAYANREVHILGYGINTDDAAFLQFLRAQKERRKARAEKILERLEAHRMHVPPDYFEGIVRGVISRSHIARAIADLGYEPDFFTAMRNWLKEGAPTFVPNDGITPQEAIAAVHAAGGYAVLAHPVRLDLESTELSAFVASLAAAGLDGIEAVYKHTASKTVRALKQLAARHGLFVTAGADYHGEGNEILPRKVSAPFIGNGKPIKA